jgi:magnesium chelatase subunit I
VRGLRAYGDLVRHAGNEALCQAVELSVLGIVRGYPLHLHAEGLRGTGKTTILRAARALLPRMLRIRGCAYNCDPRAPHCPEHRGMGPAEVMRLGTEWVATPFLEISPSAKIGTVVGSIDLGRLAGASAPEAALLPGTLARAHRGVVFVDEINRLADTSPELADALLDVMGTKPGRLQIEETGLPHVELACRVSVWAASNPDEEPGPLADIRRQLADRFDLAVAMHRPGSPEDVVAVLAPDEFGAGLWAEPGGGAEETARLALRLRARGASEPPGLPGPLRRLLGEVYCGFQLESLRAVQAWQAAARLQALAEGASEVGLSHLLAVAPSVLRHRMEPEELARALAHLERGGQGERQVQEMAGAAAGTAATAPEAAVPGPAPAAGTEAGSRGGWQDLLARLRGAVGGSSVGGTGDGGSAQPGGHGDRRQGGGAGAGRGAAAGAAGGAGSALADPQDVPLFAPPFSARPLRGLAEDAWLRPGTAPRPRP